MEYLVEISPGYPCRTKLVDEIPEAAYVAWSNRLAVSAHLLSPLAALVDLSCLIFLFALFQGACIFVRLLRIF
jgi:hypothetical protein